MNLGNIRLADKIFAVVGLLALVAAGIAGLAASNLSTLSTATDEIDLTAQEIRVSGRLGQNVVELNRAEYRLAANPADYAEVMAAIEEARKQLEERLARAEATAAPQQKILLEDVRAAYRSYAAELDATVALARRHMENVAIGAEQKEILASVVDSRRVAAALREKIDAYVEFTDRKGTEISAEASATADTAMTLLITIAAIGILAGAALGWVVANHGVVKPIRNIVACLRRLAEGDLEVDVFGAQRRDEVGDIARTMQVFKDTAVEARRLEAEQEENERRAAAEKRAATLKLADDLEAGTKEVLSTLSSSSTEMEATAGSMSAIAEETSRQSQAVAAAAEQASANVQTVATAAEELSSSVNEISRQVSQSTTMAARAVDDAHRTNEQVKALSDAAERIGDVVNLITDIANQTNLLALNATIEAARAGEAGKGFAVVATEVKSLATQTAKATDEIAQQIGGIQGATTDAVSAIQSIATTIGEISEIATSIAAAVEEQGLATQEIARNVAEASEGTKEVTRNISGVNAAAGETGAAATQVLATSSELSQGTTSLKGVVDEFLRTIRAA